MIIHGEFYGPVLEFYATCQSKKNLNPKTTTSDPAVAKKVKNFMDLLGPDIGVRTIEGNPVLPNPNMFKARYTCVFQESGKSEC